MTYKTKKNQKIYETDQSDTSVEFSPHRRETFRKLTSRYIRKNRKEAKTSKPFYRISMENSEFENRTLPRVYPHRFNRMHNKDSLRSSTRIHGWTDSSDGKQGNKENEVQKLQEDDKDKEKETENDKEKENKEEETLISPYNIASILSSFTTSFPKANITVEVLGRTLEYNDIVIAKIWAVPEKEQTVFRSKDVKYAEETPGKKIVFIVHCLTLMGYYAVPALSSNIKFKKLLSFYLEHLDKFDIFIIPLANPDGLSKIRASEVYAADTMWNKNVSPQKECSGVALDRNFDIAWDATKVVSSCGQHYPGPQPFSEAETRAVRSVLHRYSHKIVAYFHVHAGTYDIEVLKGDAILFPKGYSDAHVEDDKYMDLRGEVDEAMKNASFQVISVAVEPLFNWYGKVTGTSVDYASSVYGIPYAMELVMQPYDGHEASDSALNEIWKRIIDVIFHNIWTNMHSSDAQKR